MSNQQRILAQVAIERMQQDMKWGGPAHDDTHGPSDWVAFITKFLGRAANANMRGEGLDDPANWPEYRDAMIKIGALAVAAVEVGDRHFGESRRELSTYGFHARDGWWFSRVGGDKAFVQIVHTDETGAFVLGTVDLDGFAWASVVASMSKAGETGETYRKARDFHFGEAQPCGAGGNYGVHGEPLMCGYLKGHEGPHAWQSLPTFSNGVAVQTEG